MTTRKNVVIIGGGFSGLGALKTLTDSERFNVTLLEATDKLGGRIKTVHFPGENVTVELGATYIHGEVGNSVYEFASQHGLAEKVASSSTPQDQCSLASNGEEVPMSIVLHYRDVITDIMEELSICGETNNWSYTQRDDDNWAKHYDFPNHSVNEYVKSRFLSITSQDKQTEYAESILDMWLMREASVNGVLDSEDVDIPSFGDYIIPLGEENISIPKGYQNLVNKLAEGLPNILLSKRVCKILWMRQNDGTNSYPVSVICTDGSQYDANHVIVTCSIGVLKEWISPSNPQPVFWPPLPPTKRCSIDRLRMGNLTRVLCHFATPILDGNTRKIYYLWREEERRELAAVYPWAVHQYSFQRIKNGKIIVVWFTGEAIHSLPKEELAEGICVTIEVFVKRKIPRPKSVQLVSWIKDENFRGSYSYNPHGTSRIEREELATPIDGDTPLQLLFAGEATHSNMYSTTHGAYDTGVREAKTLVRHYQDM